MHCKRLALLSLLLIILLSAMGFAGQGTRRGYINRIPPESPSAREVRHKRVAERRVGPMATVHRGAWAFAPENTLEAFAAAMDYGLDGVEFDLRQTADGVVICIHDGWLGRLTDGFGFVQDHAYYDLLGLGVHSSVSAVPDGQFATFAALLVLARQRAMLLHLDIKAPDIEDEIARMLDEADAWDQVVCINENNAAKIRTHQKYQPVNIRSFQLGANVVMSPEAMKRFIPKPGECTVVDDPRLMARELNRPPYKPVPLPDGLYADWEPNALPVPKDGKLVPSACVRSLAERINPNSEAQLMTVLTTRRMERIQPGGSEEYQRLRTERILARAWAAQQLGQMGDKSPDLVKLLEYQVTNRSLHDNWDYHALDGIYAARALGKLGAVESVPVLVDAFSRNDPVLTRLTPTNDPDYPISMIEYRFQHEILTALGNLRCDASKRFLVGYLAVDEATAKEIPMFKLETATRALMNQDLTVEEIIRLLTHPSATVKGPAILICLDHPTEARTTALRTACPWALDLPRAAKR